MSLFPSTPLSIRVRMTRTIVSIMLGWMLMPATHAADGVNLEGTWKISAPQTAFKPVSGDIPFTGKGRKRYRENKRHQSKRNYDVYDYAMGRCSSPGVPRIMLTPSRFQILQRSEVVLFAFEWNRVRRLVALPALPPQQIIDSVDQAEIVGSMMGKSKGRWEGDTLVVTTENFSDKTLIDQLVPHGYDMKVTELFRRHDSDTLENRITIEDPEYFTRPWETVITYKRQPEEAFAEDVCLDRLDAGKPMQAK